MFIQLGAIGDLLNILPLIHDVYLNSGKTPQDLLVSRPYAPILDACSYITPRITDEHYGDVDNVERYLRANRARFHTLQVWRKGRPNRPRLVNYQMDNWYNGSPGWAKCFQQRPLSLDRRDHHAESLLYSKYDNGRPMILAALEGKSSPYIAADVLLTRLRAEFPDHNVIDLRQVTADKPQHLLGLFDNARALIAIDTMHQHLACASSVPVVALHHDTRWNASCRRPNHIFYAPYSKADHNSIINAVASAGRYNGRIIPVISDHHSEGETAERRRIADDSWNSTRVPITVSGPTVDGMPFVPDIIDAAFAAAPDADAIVLTNSDIGRTAQFFDALRLTLSVKDAAFAWRHTVQFADANTPRSVILSGLMDGGMDMVAVKRSWWNTYRDAVPRQVFACAQWDVTWRDFIIRNGGGELYGHIWHIAHTPQWRRDSAGSALNHRIHKDYARRFNQALPFG